MSMDKTPDRIAEQAAEYFARRTSGARREPSDGLRDWLRADPRHAQAYGETQVLWEQLGELRDDDELQALKQARLAELRRERPRSRLGAPLLAMAATLVLLLGGYVVYLRDFGAEPPVPYATMLGEQRTERLQDGSQLVLNTDTAVQAAYTRSRREIELLRGEAQFNVAHDAARPFVVKVGEGSVTALGTRFQVRREADATLVTLLEGSVEVAFGQQRHLLRPDEQARLSAADGLVVARIDPDAVSGWLDGWLRFRATPLEQVIAEANRYSPRKLRLGSPELAGVEMNGTFRTGKSEAIAAAAAMILPVRVDDSGEDIVLLPLQ
ncbi:FecR domain-containing protein [Luteimonas sp. BDR2-5]|uniref:FecR family protein n=1 Tax=Proluteimonas luteida TaxID=2878685 RepID=UPI001E418F7E|nr:FecR domain-containing protein [Luteimonas sp. BDR2-5]MCD9026700.1 FecR domain-containing protein [Luteimonas sp. BDR2-5]